eukprot:gnl/MRDRNA2_/MRDRNA2_111353_c0_seq1.p1 gnl/MRDRNA2_/MRDRNA2_111353_c0~~gnl/MRDRNA2_/MRDRNA2_111353_c0_seq1.p1  ORF type:complete len:287 (-),score=55.64 gnl/MRDRNA2_/MRDRNA2_111353_c0_seq1:20-880(-)
MLLTTPLAGLLWLSMASLLEGVEDRLHSKYLKVDLANDKTSKSGDADVDQVILNPHTSISISTHGISPMSKATGRTRKLQSKLSAAVLTSKISNLDAEVATYMGANRKSKPDLEATALVISQDDVQITSPAMKDDVKIVKPAVSHVTQEDVKIAKPTAKETNLTANATIAMLSAFIDSTYHRQNVFPSFAQSPLGQQPLSTAMVSLLASMICVIVCIVSSVRPIVADFALAAHEAVPPTKDSTSNDPPIKECSGVPPRQVLSIDHSKESKVMSNVGAYEYVIDDLD